MLGSGKPGTQNGRSEELVPGTATSKAQAGLVHRWAGLSRESAVVCWGGLEGKRTPGPGRGAPWGRGPTRVGKDLENVFSASHGVSSG